MAKPTGSGLCHAQKPTKTIGQHVVFALDVTEGRVIVFQVETPADHPLTIQSAKGEVFVVGKNSNAGPQGHRTKFFEAHKDGQEFFFHHSVVLLRVVELVGPIHNGSPFLNDSEALA